MVRNNSRSLNELLFDNVTDFRRYLDANVDVNENSNAISRGGDWTGVESWEKFEEYLDEGNSDITKEVRKHTQFYINKFEDKLTESSEFVFDVVGEFFDIGAVMVGEPEAWIKEVKVKDDKFIELTIQGTYMDGTDLFMVRENGSKVMAIAKTLEKQGFLVILNMAFGTKGSDTRSNKVKDYDQGLDFKKFGIVLGVPFMRRGFCRLLEIEYDKHCKITYGAPYTADDEISLARTGDILDLEKKLEG